MEKNKFYIFFFSLNVKSFEMFKSVNCTMNTSSTFITSGVIPKIARNALQNNSVCFAVWEKKKKKIENLTTFNNVV